MHHENSALSGHLFSIVYRYMCGWLPCWGTSVLLSLAGNLNIVRCIATEQRSGNEKVTWKCSLKTTSPPCAAVSYGHRFRCISVVSQLFALFCISYNWKAVSGFVLGGNKYLSDLIIINDSFVIWRCCVILSRFWVAGYHWCVGKQWLLRCSCIPLSICLQSLYELMRMNTRHLWHSSLSFPLLFFT